MTRKVNSLKWVVILVMSILSVGFAVSCSDDDKCSGNSCVTQDSGPQTDKDVKGGDGIQNDERTPDQKVVSGKCPVVGTRFDCIDSQTKKKSVWVFTGVEYYTGTKTACEFEDTHDKSKALFYYSEATGTAVETFNFATCTLAK